MYQIDKTSNSITKLTTRPFAELGFGERTHLQEWIAKCPNCLGEELLIIAKEFDGFDEIRERLDLLALDKQGGLVVIENKLDDSGRDASMSRLVQESMPNPSSVLHGPWMNLGWVVIVVSRFVSAEFGDRLNITSRKG